MSYPKLTSPQAGVLPWWLPQKSNGKSQGLRGPQQGERVRQKREPTTSSSRYSSGKIGRFQILRKTRCKLRILADKALTSPSMFYPFLSIRVSSVSEKFQKNMNQILQALEGLECSIDDVLVHGENQEEYDERLEAVLKRLVEAGVTFNLD